MSKFIDWLKGEDVHVTHNVEARDISPVTGNTVIPPHWQNDLTVNPEIALTLGVVYRSVDVLVNMTSSMELGVYRNGIEQTDRLPSFMREPSEGVSMKNFIEEVTFSLAVYGNAYVKVIGDTNPALVVLSPQSVTVTKDDNGLPVYYVNGTRQPKGRIRQLKNTRKPGELLGIGPVQAGQEEIRAALMLRKFQNDWFDLRTVPSGVLTTDLVLSATQAAEYANAWEEFLKNSGGTAVLGQGLSYESLQLKPAEAQFLEVQEANNKNIARLFGIPAMHALVELGGTSMTYTNLEESNILFQQNTLSKYITEIEEFLSSLMPRNTRVLFKTEGLLRMSTKTQWEIKKIQSDLGYYSGAEQRKAEGKPALKPVDTPETQNTVNKMKDNEENGD